MKLFRFKENFNFKLFLVAFFPRNFIIYTGNESNYHSIPVTNEFHVLSKPENFINRIKRYRINPTDIYLFIYLLFIRYDSYSNSGMVPSFCILLTATLVTGRFLDILFLYRSLNYRLLITI